MPPRYRRRYGKASGVPLMQHPDRRSDLIARAAMDELPPAERAALLTALLIETRNLRLLVQARNRLTQEIDEVIEAIGLEDDEC